MAATAIETETSAFLSAEKVEELHAIWEKTLEDFIKEQEQKKGSGLNATRLRQLGKKANEVQQKVFGHVRTFLPPPPPPELEPVQGSKALLEQEEAAKEEEEKRKQQERELSQHLSSDFEQTINDLFVINKPPNSDSVPNSEPETVSKSGGEERQATTEEQLREAIRSRQEKLALIEKTVPLALKEITHQLFSRHLTSFVEASTSPQYAVDEATLQEGFQLKTASDPEIAHLKQTLFSVYSELRSKIKETQTTTTKLDGAVQSAKDLLALKARKALDGVDSRVVRTTELRSKLAKQLRYDPLN